jgi:hypothetical protein
LTAERSHWLAVGLLLILFAQLATSSTVKSPVFDEPLHTARAYYVTATGNWDMQAGHLPLLYRLLGPLFWALPERPAPAGMTGAKDHVEMARDIIRALDRPWDMLIFPLRVVVMGLTLFLGATLYRWAGERHGARGGLLALFVYTFSPNVLAHGRLVTTDLLLTCFFFLAVYVFQRLLRHPNMERCAAASLSLGLAMGSKVSALLLPPTLILLVVGRWTALRSDPERPSGPAAPRFRRFLSDMTWLAFAGLLAAMVVWFLYGFESGPWAEAWPALPLPSYVKTLSQVQEHGATRGHPAFLAGKRSGGGWSTYFPIALAIKTPMPTLIGALAGAAWLLLQKRWWDWLTACLPGALFLAAATVSSLNIGYRHILPVVPFIILLLSAVADLPWHRLPVAAAGGGLAIWLVMGTLSIHPDYLAFFNELAGGPRGGHRYLTDSNLDWGQDLKQLRDYLDEQNIDRVHLSYFGNVDPGTYGIDYDPLPSHFPIGEVKDFTPFAPEPGIYAISVTNLSGQFLVENPTVLDWFNHQDPIVSIGHSINVYQVESDSSAPTWVGICRAPGAPLESETFSEQVGRRDLRFIAFDCRSSWVFANGGESAWFVVPATEETESLAPPAGSWLTTYEQENYDGKLLFTLYRWRSNTALQAHLDALRTTSALPTRVGDTLTLLGYEMDQQTAKDSQPTIRLRAYWRVLAQPSQPLSLMAHLVNAEGKPLAIGDALDVPVEGWAPGDIIVQEHRLGLESETSVENGQLLAGAYWLPSLERLPAFDREGDRLSEDVIRLTRVDMERVP